MDHNHEELESVGYQHGIEDFMLNPAAVRMEFRDGILTIQINFAVAGIGLPVESVGLQHGRASSPSSTAPVPGIGAPSSDDPPTARPSKSDPTSEDTSEVHSPQLRGDYLSPPEPDSDLEVDDETGELVVDNPFFVDGASSTGEEPLDGSLATERALVPEDIPESARTLNRSKRRQRSAMPSPRIDRPSTSRRRGIRRTSRIANDPLLQEIQSRIEDELSSVLPGSQDAEARLARLHQLAEYRRYDLQHGGRRRPDGARNRCYFCWAVVGPGNRSTSGLVCRTCE
ncbi:hypothetical protein QAD02_012741 [Eretmocerus hayati]|uniref:Uncharacterized protein n=2 Tax=Eretmocerus hayati TaxID=131215 RepID=A0ACC2NCF6_9HYME|nr:hypothetical protein QAD02_008982 [Eretmocerus hayati]KAJ8676954.1 hypothetical protein QAD02_012741 [Eretmocerus hayati]